MGMKSRWTVGDKMKDTLLAGKCRSKTRTEISRRSEGASLPDMNALSIQEAASGLVSAVSG
jgi:hypothetical protein